MSSDSQPLCLDVHFDGVSENDAHQVVPGAASLPEFAASCGPTALRQSCECSGDPCNPIEPVLKG